MTTLASTSRVQLAYAPETVFGVTPEAPAVGRSLRYTGEGLNYTLSKETSQEINAYRGSSSAIAVSGEASGNVSAELSYAEYDDLIAATLQDSWKDYASGAFEATVTEGAITLAAPLAGNAALTNLLPGQWFVLKGTGTANDGKLLRVNPTTAPTGTILTLDPGTPAVPGSVTGAVLEVSRLTNGVTQRSFSIEKLSADTGEHFLFRGMTPSTMSLNVATASRTTLEFNFMGRDSVASNVSGLPGPLEPSKGYQIMSGVSGKSCALWYGGAPLEGTVINSIALSYDNALRMQNAICSLGAVGIGSGTIAVTVDLEVYFASGRAFYDEFLTNQDNELSFTAFDTEGNGYVFTLPKANVASYSALAGSRDQDLIASISMTGLMYLSEQAGALRGKVLVIDRIGAVVV